MQQQLQVKLSHIIHVQISILLSLMPNYHWLKSVSLILFRAVMTVMTVTNKQYKIGSVTSSHYSIHFKRSVWVPIPIQVLERCIPTIKMCQKSPKILSIRFELGSWKKSRYLINLRWEGKYVQRGWEMQSKVTVELPTDRPVLGQSVDRLPVDDWQQGKQVGTEGRQSQAPANHPRADQLLRTHTDTLFQEID